MSVVILTMGSTKREYILENVSNSSATESARAGRTRDRQAINECNPKIISISRALQTNGVHCGSARCNTQQLLSSMHTRPKTKQHTQCLLSHIAQPPSFKARKSSATESKGLEGVGAAVQSCFLWGYASAAALLLTRCGLLYSCTGRNAVAGSRTVEPNHYQHDRTQSWEQERHATRKSSEALQEATRTGQGWLQILFYTCCKWKSCMQTINASASTVVYNGSRNF